MPEPQRPAENAPRVPLPDSVSGHIRDTFLTSGTVVLQGNYAGDRTRTCDLRIMISTNEARYGAVEPSSVKLVLVRAGCNCRVGDTFSGHDSALGSRTVFGGGCTIRSMVASRATVQLTEPEFAGSYVVIEKRADGSLVLEPETVDEVVAGLADRPLSEGEQDALFRRLDAAADRLA